MQVIVVGAALGIAAFFVAQYMTKADKDSMRLIRRNENLNIATSFSDYVNDREQVVRSSAVVDQIGAGPVILYP
jgi:hypothetical protein